MPTRHQSTAAQAAAARLGFIATAAALAALAAVAFLLLHPGAGSAAQARGPIVSTAPTSLGRIVVNSSGRTLYLFGKDQERQKRLLRNVRDLLAAVDRGR